MSISVQCSSCQKKLTAKDELLGKRVKCPACGAPLTVEAAPVPASTPAAAVPPRKRSEAAPPPIRATPASLPRARAKDAVDEDGAEDADEKPELSQSEETKPKRHEPRRKRDGEVDREPGARPTGLLRGVSPDYRIDVNRWFSIARANYRAVVGPCIGYFFVFAFALGLWWVVSAGAVAVLTALASDGVAMGVTLTIGLPVLAFLLPALAIGFHVVCQQQIKGEEWNFGTFFTGFRWSLPLAGRALLLGLVEVATAIPIVAIKAIGEAIGGLHPPALIGLVYAVGLGCALVGGYVLFRLMYFSHFLMIDRGCGAIESLRGSWLLSRGHFWGLFAALLLTLGSLNLISLLALGSNLLFPIPVFVLLPLLVIGAIVQLVAFPAGVLFLNAGYLLVAGKEPLPDHPRESERTEPGPSSVLAWLPVGLASACIVLFGVVVMLWQMSEQERGANLDQKRREEGTRLAERAKQDQARARVAAEQAAKELVGFFRDGGIWSMELSPWREEAVEAGLGVPPGGGPLGGPGRFGPGGLGGAATRRPQRVLVLGPRDLLKTKQLIKLGVPLEPNADWTAKKQKIENLPFSSLVREEFFRRFAEAMNSGEVEAVLVEAVLESPNGGASGAGGPGASGVGGPGGIGAPPVPGAIVAPGPGDGGAAAPASQWHGVPVPLAKATPLTRESFQKFVDDQFGPASGR